SPKMVPMKTILGSKKFHESHFEMAIALGKTISNETFTFDLTKMPHLLVAGATGQGKSVGLNAIIASLLYKKHPAQLKFVMIDPKKVELSLFSKIENHFLAKLEDTEEPIITDTQKVISTLNALCAEMDTRYDLLQAAHVRNIKEYNKKFISRKLNPEKGHRYMPFIVVVIDEFADLIMTAGRSIETPISRLAQLARAIGIHLVIATQRPTTNIITGVIKANFPARIAFRVSSGIDSRTILDGPGADQLIGRGDMLFMSGSEPVRIQCAFIDTPEIDALNEFIGNQKGFSSPLELKGVDDVNTDTVAVDLKKRDDLFEEAARLVVLHQQGSTSLIQRKLALGYNRAGRIVDQLEASNILGPPEGSKARQVLVKDDFTLEQILKELE
ncbi:MAG: FtsK/SpoIIIE domain-containing protein, partial [Bacteroidales bacterium]|nr:FtsK/SpoIIIE domain-containing protein [Bacteroidales bacterium]